jgi:hypothetical protein
MSALPLDTTLCLLQAAPCVIALTKGKDQGTKVICGILLAMDLVLGLGPYVGLEVHGRLLQGACVALAILGIVAALRVGQHALAALLITSGALMALLALGVVRGTLLV